MAPRFSILLPTHNRPGLLRLAISSVLAQTERDFELFIVGDGCTDNSSAVVAGFKDDRIRWFDLPKAPGFGYANRNVALKQSSGEYIAFVADDDLVFPDHLQVLAAALDKPGAEWAYNRPLWVTTDGVVVPFGCNLLNADELDAFLTVGNLIPATCVMYRRSCLAAYGYWPEDVLRAGDWRYWIRIIEGGQRVNLAYSPVPTSLHFNALWKTTPETQLGQVNAGREIAASAPWWPASLKVSMTPGIAEQRVFFDLIGSHGYIERLRRDVSLAVERLAWLQLTDASSLLPGVRADLQTATRRADQTQARLDAVEASTSWRLTSALRAVSNAIRRKT
jgi:cellulose synthase/poly-beta-1,6-N-acetylglucosamine synthase-like glycosyltransferase